MTEIWLSDEVFVSQERWECIQKMTSLSKLVHDFHEKYVAGKMGMYTTNDKFKSISGHEKGVAGKRGMYTKNDNL